VEITIPAVGDQPPQTINIPDRSGVSPIGTSNPNSGSSADTNSTYGIGAYTSGISVQSGTTTYTIQNTDYQGIILFNTASAITVTLNSVVKANFQATILNIGAGAITLTTSDGSLINQGSSSLTLSTGQGVQVFFANRTWTAYAGTTVIPTFPKTLTLNYVAETSNYAINPLVDYQIEATSGTFTVTLPTATTITGQEFSIKNSGTGVITVATTSSQTIDGSLTQTLTQYDNLVVMSNGTNWIIV
jgi:hypothetical protein